MNCYHQWNRKQIYCDADAKITKYTVECGLCFVRYQIETPYDLKKRNSYLTKTGFYGTIKKIK
jgi:transcription elongation factor Elf1